jgi:heme-degrading monooxygenase HmoA
VSFEMMTVITHVSLKPGAEPEWDQAMQDRLMAARGQPGWVGGQLLIPLDGLNRRVIVGTWVTRADWEAWHSDPAFQETRQRMDGLQDGPSQMEWFEVVTEARETARA